MVALSFEKPRQLMLVPRGRSTIVRLGSSTMITSGLGPLVMISKTPCVILHRQRVIVEQRYFFAVGASVFNQARRKAKAKTPSPASTGVSDFRLGRVDDEAAAPCDLAAQKCEAAFDGAEAG